MSRNGELLQAVKHGDIERTQRLLAAGANPDAKTAGEWPALALAQGAPMVAILVAAGADPDAPMPDGMTCLMHACRGWRTEQVEALLQAGADPAMHDLAGRTAADHALADFLDVFSNRFARLHTLRVLSAHGVLEQEVWLAFARELLVQGAGSGRVQDVRDLLKLGIAADAADARGTRPLDVARRGGWVHVEQLLREGPAAPPRFRTPEAPRPAPADPARIEAGLQRIRSLLASACAPQLLPPIPPQELAKLQHSRGIALPSGFVRMLTELGQLPMCTPIEAALADAGRPERPFPLAREYWPEPDPSRPESTWLLPEGAEPDDGTIELRLVAGCDLDLLVVTGDRHGQVWEEEHGVLRPKLLQGAGMDVLDYCGGLLEG